MYQGSILFIEPGPGGSPPILYSDTVLLSYSLIITVRQYYSGSTSINEYLPSPRTVIPANVLFIRRLTLLIYSNSY